MVVACGNNDNGQCRLPPLAAGKAYTQVAAGGNHTFLLRSDGVAVASGHQCTLPPLAVGQTYTQVAAGAGHGQAFYTVLLRSDGVAVACGPAAIRTPVRLAADGCNLPPLAAGKTYTHVAVGPNLWFLFVHGPRESRGRR